MAVFLSALVLAWLALLTPVYASDSGCVKCHTSEKILQALHKPAKVEIREGVG